MGLFKNFFFFKIRVLDILRVKKKIKNWDISIVFDLSVLRFWISTVYVVTVYVLSLPFYDVIDFLNFWTCQYSRTIYFETVEFQDTLLISDIFYCYYQTFLKEFRSQSSEMSRLVAFSISWPRNIKFFSIIGSFHWLNKNTTRAPRCLLV